VTRMGAAGLVPLTWFSLEGADAVRKGILTPGVQMLDARTKASIHGRIKLPRAPSPMARFG